MDFDDDRKKFLDAFPGLKTFQLFDDTGKRKSMARIFHCESLPVKWTLRLEELNCAGAGVYLCINETDGTGRTNACVKKIRACFADFDGEPPDAAHEDGASMIVETSPGKFHAYFLVEDSVKGSVPLESFRVIQEAIADKYHSDPAVKDLARVMRVPGFFHNKECPFLSRVVHYTGARFGYGQLVEMFPPIPREQFSGDRWRKAKEHTGDGEFKGQYGAAAPGRNVHIMRRIGGMLKRGLSWRQIENEAMKEALACVPPLSEREAWSVLRSAKRYA